MYGHYGTRFSDDLQDNIRGNYYWYNKPHITKQFHKMNAEIITVINDQTGEVLFEIFKSYYTECVLVDYVNRVIYCSGTYSPTTAKQLSRFCREYLNRQDITYYDLKKIAYDNTKYIRF